MDPAAPLFERSGTYENNSLVRGKFVQPGQGLFEGEFKNGKKEGHGKQTWASGPQALLGGSLRPPAIKAAQCWIPNRSPALLPTGNSHQWCSCLSFRARSSQRDSLSQPR